MGGLVRISTGKAIQSRGPGHSVKRRTLKSEKLLSSSPSRKSALIVVFLMYSAASREARSLRYIARNGKIEVTSGLKRPDLPQSPEIARPARNSGLPEVTPQNTSQKYRRNTPKIPKMPILGIFFGIFGGLQNFGRSR